VVREINRRDFLDFGVEGVWIERRNRQKPIQAVQTLGTSASIGGIREPRRLTAMSGLESKGPAFPPCAQKLQDNESMPDKNSTNQDHCLQELSTHGKKPYL
jgi:hypothetical protein